jgi:TRAP transporter TAXI family solute receptor
MKKWMFSVVLVFVALSLCAAAWGESQRPKNIKLDMMGFVPGTPLQADAEAMGMALMREYPDWKVRVLASRKGPAGVSEAREKKTVDVFIQLGPWKAEKVVYTPIFKHLNYEKDMAYQALAPHSVRPVHLLVLKETGLTSFKDLITKRFPARIGYDGLGYEIVLRKTIEYYGITWADMEAWGCKHVMANPTIPTGADIMKQKGYNVAILYSDAPNPLLLNVHETVGLRMLPLEEGLRDFLREQLGFTKTVLPAKTYKFLEEDCPTVRQEASICAVTGKISDDVAYYICKGLWSQTKFIATESRNLGETLVVENIAGWCQARADQDLELHPGALKYYREQGWIK